MKLIKARVQNYRSIKDTGEFDIENIKTILVGPNEAGKTAILQALQKLNPPESVADFHALRDYPRSLYNEITTNRVKPEDIDVVTGYFELDDEDKANLHEDFHSCIYRLTKRMDNSMYHSIENGPKSIIYKNINKDLQRLSLHVENQKAEDSQSPSSLLSDIVEKWDLNTVINTSKSEALKNWLEKIAFPLIDESNETEDERYDSLIEKIKKIEIKNKTLVELGAKVPLFILFNNYFSVKPLIHLEHLAERIDTNIMDDDKYDYGNQCLLKLLGFTARELSESGKTIAFTKENEDAHKSYRDKLDSRQYQLNAASVRLTNEILSIWKPNQDRGEADKLRMIVDGQYLKVVVEDDLGVEIELDQRSEGFQWLVSFFVVFFAEAEDAHKNSILLLDEPGVSLHGLKQRDFRSTLSRLAEKNQTIYTTHSPFLVGPNELDIVRVVEMKSRNEGTKVHTTVTAGDSNALLPLQEALGYDLAQSLFSNQRNLILEGLTDCWYIEATSQLLRAGGIVDLNDKISLIPSNSASKVVYFATILKAQKLKVAALLDSDSAGDNAAKQDSLVGTLGNKAILRTKDFYTGDVVKSEVEDLLRETLINIAKSELGWDIEEVAKKQKGRAVIDIFSKEINGFSKYKLAKAYINWTKSNQSSDLQVIEINNWKKLIEKINSILK
jgi:predicted ATP-dependent endonuclease of OLD family